MKFHADPFQQFQIWYDEAVSGHVQDVDAMVLATASKQGRPSARVVLFKGIEFGGLTFFTNYRSQKGLDLLENPQAALLFFWPGRQIRFEGLVEPLSAQASTEYWNSRPRESQLSGFISEQSQVIPSFDFLENAVQEARERFRGQLIPRPEHWGGFRVIPDRVEFWTALVNRLHHRVFYQKTSEGWKTEFLSP